MKYGTCLDQTCGQCALCRTRMLEVIKPLGLTTSDVTPKPTLGLRPWNIWIYCRIQEISEALQRQADAGEELNMAWVLEMQEITEMIKE